MALILQVAVPCPLRQTFDYLPNEVERDWQPGLRVKVPFGSRKLIGFVVKVTEQSDTKKLKKVIECLDDNPILPLSLFKLILWTSQYYHHPIGDCFQVALPRKILSGEHWELALETHWSLLSTEGSQAGLGSKQQAILDFLNQQSHAICQTELLSHFGSCQDVLKRLAKRQLIQSEKRLTLPVSSEPLSPLKKLNSEQSHTVETIFNNRSSFSTSLLKGVTGSGKTEVYIHLAASMIAAGQQVLILIPEIGLTTQFVQRFKQHLSASIVVFHSAMSEGERHQSWLLAQQGHADIVIGTRSSVFTPLERLGLIILDEEHDSSYKQQDSLRYHARHIALKRAKQANIPVLLGSATPSLESFHHAQSERYQLLNLNQRATGANMPSVQLIDSRGPQAKNGISSELYRAIENELALDHQVLLFINKRGFAPVLMCHDCNWQAVCPDCDAKLIIHQGRYQLRCHHCGYNQPLIQQCPECQGTDLGHYGVGTEQIETELTSAFPDVPLLRIDRDTTQKVGSFESMVKQVQQGGAGILVGTQMLAKGHDFHNVTLVGVLDADQGLFSADFRATELLSQLIIQVAGRAGRGDKAGKVYIQTQQADHPFWHDVIKQDYAGIARRLLAERQQSVLPPFGSLCVIRAQGKFDTAAMQFLSEVSGILNRVPQQSVLVLGPVPAVMEKRAGYYRAQLLLSTQDRKGLHQLLDHTMEAISTLKSGNKVRWSIDVDPIDLL